MNVRQMNFRTFPRRAAVALVGVASLGAASLIGLSPAQALDSACAQVATTVTCTYTADSSFVVPAGLTTLRILAVGGNGANGQAASGGTGGLGDALTSDFAVGSMVAVGQVLTLTIGGNADGNMGGANGGANGGNGSPGLLAYDGGGGGGATVVVAGAERIAIGAGGGGGGGGAGIYGGGHGGDAYLTGSDINGTDGTPGPGTIYPNPGHRADGATGGAGGGNGFSGTNGSAVGPGGKGGDAAPNEGLNLYAGAGGGGGAGYVGGGGGGGGGVGSGGGATSGLSFTAGTTVSRVASDGAPRVVITYEAFIVGPTATISGPAGVGSTLTAGEGMPSPAADSYGYKWYANGVLIGGATDKTYTLTSAEAGKAITVEVTAIRAGYADASDLSEPTSLVTSYPAKHLDMDESTTKAVVGKVISVDVKDLAPGEPYTITIGGTDVGTGHADSKGRVKTTVDVPTSLPLGKTHIEVVGSQPLRNDSDVFTITKPGKLDVDLDHSSVKAGKTQKMKIEGLHPNGEVTIEGDDFTPTLHVADNSGKYSITFPVGTVKGTHIVKVTDSFDGRSSTKTFKVK